MGQKMKKLNFLIVVAAITTWSVSHAAALLIDFGSDGTGAVPNGFSSVSAAGVYFTDTLGEDLYLDDFGGQSDGVGLAVNSDDPSTLQIDFDWPQNSISLDFGNDDPVYTAEGDLAHLSLWMGAAFVDEVTVVMNRDDLMNQTIQYSGSEFDRAVFAYTNPALTPIDLIEIVDNIAIASEGVTPDLSPVPTMSSWGIALLIALFGLVGLRRRSFG
jgi:hypothetical protein